MACAPWEQNAVGVFLRRVHWAGYQAMSACHRRSVRCGLRRAQEEWQVQLYQHGQDSAEARGGSEAGHQPIHQATVHVEGQAASGDLFRAAETQALFGR